MGTVASRLEKLAAAGLPVAPLTLCETDDAVREAAAALTVDGGLYTWGKGTRGQLGHGNARDVVRPARVAAGTLLASACMSRGSCATAGVVVVVVVVVAWCVVRVRA